MSTTRGPRDRTEPAITDQPSTSPDGTSAAPDRARAASDGASTASDGASTAPDGAGVALDGAGAAPDQTPAARQAVEPSDPAVCSADLDVALTGSADGADPPAVGQSAMSPDERAESAAEPLEVGARVPELTPESEGRCDQATNAPSDPAAEQQELAVRVTEPEPAPGPGGAPPPAEPGTSGAVTPAERRARATLTGLTEPGDLALARMVARHGAVAALAEITSGDAARSGFADYRARLAGTDTSRYLDRAEALGARLICPGDAEWPESLDRLVEAGCAEGRGGPPLALWLRGPADLAEVTARSCAIVGARSATQYGCYAASELAAGLTDREVTVISGAAFGIDAAAHRGAFAAEGRTLAILACGVDVPYPKAHAALLEQIAQTGLVISEVPPGTNPTRPRFLVRNRLIAALAQGTVVVQAGLRSGALNTAGWAERCSRQVMGVPGPITSAESAGVHQLIRDHGAVLVTDAAEVLEQIGPIGTDLAPPKLGEPRSRDALDARTRRVLEAVPVRVARPVEPIAATAGIPIAEAHAALGRLWCMEFVERHAAGWRLSARERRLDPQSSASRAAS